MLSEEDIASLIGTWVLKHKLGRGFDGDDLLALAHAIAERLAEGEQAHAADLTAHDVELAEMREAIEAVPEWDKPYTDGVCAFCRNVRLEGHHADCKRQQAVAATPKREQPCGHEARFVVGKDKERRGTQNCALCILDDVQEENRRLRNELYLRRKGEEDEKAD